jgi:hypothetical protein
MAERSSQTKSPLNNVAAIFGVDREGNLTLGTLGIGVAFISLAFLPLLGSD